MPRYDDDYDRDDPDDDRPKPRRGDDHEYGRYEEDDEYDDYDDRPRKKRGGRNRAREKVNLPAIFLMIVGGLGIAMFFLNLFVELSGMNQGPNPFQPQGPRDPAAENVGKVIGFVVQVIWAGIVFFGGLQMRNLNSRGFVLFSCIWAMLPCNLCCILGIPFGIWGLVVINDENVKRYF